MRGLSCLHICPWIGVGKVVSGLAEAQIWVLGIARPARVGLGEARVSSQHLLLNTALFFSTHCTEYDERNSHTVSLCSSEKALRGVRLRPFCVSKVSTSESLIPFRLPAMLTVVSSGSQSMLSVPLQIIQCHLPANGQLDGNLPELQRWVHVKVRFVHWVNRDHFKE